MMEKTPAPVPRASPGQEHALVRLTTREDRDGARVVQIDGRLDAGSVEALEALVSSMSAPVVIELSGLGSADATALRALAALRRRGCRLRGASLYISRLLEEH